MSSSSSWQQVVAVAAAAGPAAAAPAVMAPAAAVPPPRSRVRSNSRSNSRLCAVCPQPQQRWTRWHLWQRRRRRAVRLLRQPPSILCCSRQWARPAAALLRQRRWPRQLRGRQAVAGMHRLSARSSWERARALAPGNLQPRARELQLPLASPAHLPEICCSFGALHAASRSSLLSSRARLCLSPSPSSLSCLMRYIALQRGDVRCSQRNGMQHTASIRLTSRPCRRAIPAPPPAQLVC